MLSSILNFIVEVWNYIVTLIYESFTFDLTTFQDGALEIISNDIYDLMVGVGLSLLVMFFLYGTLEQLTNLQEAKRPEFVFKILLRFTFAQMLVKYGKDIFKGIFDVVLGMIQLLNKNLILGQDSGKLIANEELLSHYQGVAFEFDLLDLGGTFEILLSALVLFILLVVVFVCGFQLILMVYGRFFKIYIYLGLIPIALSASSSQKTEQIALTYVKTFISICLEGLIIMIAFIISAKMFNAISLPIGLKPLDDWNTLMTTVQYAIQMAFQILMLTGIVKSVDNFVSSAFALR